MRNLKKTMAMLLSLVMVGSVFAGCNGDKDSSTEATTTTTAATTATTAAPVELPADTGKVLTIYCWNTEFQDRFNGYYADKMPADVTVNWVITPNENNAYQNKLDADLDKQDGASEPIDIFLIEADYALKYADDDSTLDIRTDLGLTDAELSTQYKYTQEIVTVDGKIKGATWQATPGLFAYRRSIAKDVLGTDDPAEVQKALADWTKFNDVAAQAAAKGYKMLSGYDDSYRTFSNNMSAPWVDGNTIKIDANLMAWADQTKEFTDKGYNNKTALWAPEWSADQGAAGKVFGFFYSTWGINFTLLGNAGEEGFGDWAVCEGPQSYYWGGTWICGAKGTDNANLVADVMRILTTDAATMKKITEDTQDYTNHEAAMNELAKDFKSDFLGGQNHIALFAASAPKIDMSNLSPYDQGLNEEFQKAFKDYFDGNVDKDTAIDNFYTGAIEKYPALKRP